MKGKNDPRIDRRIEAMLRSTSETKRQPHRSSRTTVAPPAHGLDAKAVGHLCEASFVAGRQAAPEAIKIAQCALSMAGLMKEPDRRTQAEAYCWGFLANARRAVGDLDGAEAAFAEAWRRWQPVQPANLEPLPEWRLHNLEASLRRDQRRFSDALDCLDKATACADDLDQDVCQRLLRRKRRLTEILITLEGGETVPTDYGSADEM
ncbi:MAG TPA: hypothetical protein VFE33_01720 [Thermoanaerobaculia bacterium]|nr:hypothetical protein [Thermoanaerobaculia bacterium]